MRAPGAGWRWWLTAPGWSTGPLMMRRWTPTWRQWGTPSKPPSHVGPGRTTRGSRATPVPAVRWRRRGRVTTAGTWRARLPRAAWACRTLPTFRWTAVIGNLTLVPSWAFGRRRQASGRGWGVRRRWRPSDPCPMLIRRGPLAGSTMATCVTASSFWTGLMLSPWHLSVVRGTQLLQQVGAHVLRSNRGTHCWLGWSVTYELLPKGSHVHHEFLLPPFDHLRGWSLGKGPSILLRQRWSDSVHAGRWRSRDKRGRGTRKKSSKAQGGRRGLFGINSRRCRWRNRGRSHCGRSCEKAWRSTRSRRAGRQRSRRWTTNHGHGNGGAPSGPHPRRWRSYVTGCRKWHADPDVRGLGLDSPGRVLEPWEGRRKAISGRRRRHRHTRRDRSARLRGTDGKRR